MLVSGLVFGLWAGLSPGPLFTLVVTESLRYGAKAGIRVAVAPIITDPPIIAVLFAVLFSFSSSGAFVFAIHIIGAGMLFYLGADNLSFSGVTAIDANIRPRSLQKGILANFTNPGPYLFWGTVGCPLMVKNAEPGILGPIIFLVAFYVVLVGAKTFLAIATAKSRTLVKTTGFVLVIRCLGLVLIGYGIKFLVDAAKIVWG